MASSVNSVASSRRYFSQRVHSTVQVALLSMFPRGLCALDCPLAVKRGSLRPQPNCRRVQSCWRRDFSGDLT